MNIAQSCWKYLVAQLPLLNRFLGHQEWYYPELYAENIYTSKVSYEQILSCFSYD